MPPPKLPLKLLKWFCKPEYHRDIEGDLLELYDRRRKTSGQTKANWHLFKDVLLLFRPGIIRSFKTSQKLNHTAMLRHNFMLTIRNFKRYKTSFLINLIGLSTGLASALLIYLWVSDELSVDKFHEKDRQLYQVMHNLQFPDYILTLEQTPIPLAEAIIKEIPEIEAALAVSSRYQNPEGVLSVGDNHLVANGLFAGENYFDVLSYKLVKGDAKQVLTDKRNIVLSEELAVKIFNSTEQVIGKTVEWSNEMFKGTFQVSGIFENPPSSSRAKFDFMFHIELLLDNDRDSREWYSSHAETYLILKEGTNVENLNAKIVDFIKGKHSLQSERSSLFVQQFSERYLHGRYKNGVLVGGRILYVRLFSAIALFILTIACINFMNLSTAQASRKMKEIGVKKAIGANRNALIVQFLGDSMLMAILSLVIAITLVILLLPQFNVITGKSLHLIFGVKDVLIVGGIVWFTGLVAGSYPAFYLSGFNPVAVLKGKRNTSSGEQWVRSGLVILQFTISIIFIVGFLIINKQIEFTQTKNLGYNRDNIISFQRKGEINNKDFEVFISELKNIPGVVNASNAYGDFIAAESDNSSFSWEGKTEEEQKPFPAPTISYDFIETLGMEIKEGRSFSREYANEGEKIVLNEAAVKMIGLQDPVGKSIKFHRWDRQIIGVVKNFHYGSLHNIVEPLFFRFGPYGRDVVVKIKSGTGRATINRLEEFYKKFHPKYPFEFTFMDDDYQVLYEAENKVSILSKYFTIIAIIISCLGLFGLATFTAERRLKEIGIRKILGSSAFGIVRMLTGDFTKIVIVAIFISLPISYLIAKNWLDNFAYKIDLGWWFFAGAGLLVLLIAWITIGMQTIKAARVNPIECLKDE